MITERDFFFFFLESDISIILPNQAYTETGISYCHCF